MKKILALFSLIGLIAVGIYLSGDADRAQSSAIQTEYTCYSNQVILQNRSELKSMQAKLKEMEKLKCDVTSPSDSVIIKKVDDPRFLIDGKSDVTLRTGDVLPVMSWFSSMNNAKYRTYLTANDAKKCPGINNNQNWDKGGKTSSGSYTHPVTNKAEKKMDGCIVTYNYEVTRVNGSKVTKKAVLRYKDICHKDQEIQSLKDAIAKKTENIRQMESESCTNMFTCKTSNELINGTKQQIYYLVDKQGKSVNHDSLAFGQANPNKGKIDINYSAEQINFYTSYYFKDTRFMCPGVTLPLPKDDDVVMHTCYEYISDGGHDASTGRITCTGDYSFSLEQDISRSKYSLLSNFFGEDTTGYCGDNSCNNGEDKYSCSMDCGMPDYCGDNSCNNNENQYSCATDCGTPPYCGDNSCNNGEDKYSCSMDCGMPDYCGDSTTSGSEQCDDGNTQSGDGCSNTCQTELGGCTDSTATNYNSSAQNNDGSCTYPVFGCTDSTATNYNATATHSDGSCTYVACGDSTTSGSEQCDDGNTQSGDGCSNTCQTELGGCTDSTATNYNSSAQYDDGSCTHPQCGNSSLESSEQCDDGNTQSGDGCDETCQNEYCGDGKVNNSNTEECDGGNDCDSSCHFICPANSGLGSSFFGLFSFGKLSWLRSDATGSGTSNCGCPNGLEKDIYPDCTCPANTELTTLKDSGYTTCKSLLCPNGLEKDIYPDCTCPRGEKIFTDENGYTSCKEKILKKLNLKIDFRNPNPWREEGQPRKPENYFGISGGFEF